MKNQGKRPRDPNQLAKSIVTLATEESQEIQFQVIAVPKNPHAVELGRLGGLKGGKARAKALTAKRRSEIAKKAAKKRWQKK